MKKTLSVPEWHQLAIQGSAPPVRIPLMGNSMYPLVRYNRDFVTVAPMEGLPETGDIVLFRDHLRDLYVMHRVWNVKEGKVLTWGDNCSGADGWIPVEEILGKAILIERGEKKIIPNPQRGMRWAKFWHHVGKVYRLSVRIKGKIPRRIIRLIKGK